MSLQQNKYKTALKEICPLLTFLEKQKSEHSLWLLSYSLELTTSSRCLSVPTILTTFSQLGIGKQILFQETVANVF